MKGLTFFLIAVFAFAIIGCEPVPETVNLVQNMAVQTNFDKDAVFSAYATYSMPLDTIGQLSNTDPEDSIILGDYAKLISRQVKTNLDNSGYNKVEFNQDPDLGINVFVVHNFNVFQSVSYGPFYGYPGYYYPGYYGYGGYYGYPYVNTYTSNTATLVIEMVDLKNKDSQNRARVVWTAYAGDLLSSIDTYGKSKEAVDQAFAQSPYVHR